MKIFPSRKLNIDIFATFAVLLGVTVVGEVLYSSYTNKELIMAFERKYYSRAISETTIKWLDEYFAKLEIILNMLSKSVVTRDNIVSSDYELLFLESLKSIPYTTSFNLSFKDGTYFQVRTLDGLKTYQSEENKKLPTYAKYAIRTMGYFGVSKERLAEKWIYLNEDYGVISREGLPVARYNATKRDWYISAELLKNKVWSDIYLFKTTGVAGMTLSMPLGYYPDGVTAIGVLGIDFMVSQLKDLLDDIKASPNSVNYLINAKNEIVVASNGMKTIASLKGGKDLEFLKAANCGDEVLGAAIKLLSADSDKHVRFTVNGKEYVAYMAKLKRIPCCLINVSPEYDFTDGLEKIQENMLMLSLLIFLISFGVIVILAQRISNPISTICQSAKAIGMMELDKYKRSPLSKIIEIQELSDAMDAMELSISTFTKYAPKDLVRRLIRTGKVPTLGGETKKLTMFFSDIEKFSTVSERLPAEYLVLHLSEYFDEVTKKIMEYNGVIDKYIGDSVMAMWGAPNADESQVVSACYAALECQSLIQELGDKWKLLGKPPLPTRIGLHTGTVVVGNIGSQDRMNFTSIGDNVNIASRLEGANKFYGTKILVSENIEMEARGKVLFRIIDKIAVKGRTSGIMIYEPLCAMNSADEEGYYNLIKLSAKSNEAFEFYQNQEFERALEKYEAILKLFPDTELSIKGIINKCREFICNPPVEWDGIYVLNSK